MDYIGVDGCPGGWFWIGLSASGRHDSDIAQDAHALATVAQNAKLMLIDIPIGLHDEGTAGRSCDIEARRVLGSPRASSVFPAPTRPAVYAASYPEACEANWRICGKRLSRQAWEICEKIRGIDELLRARADLRPVIRETHPEVCFWSLNGKQPMSENKKRAAGRAARLRALSQVCSRAESIVEAARKGHPRNKVASDDIIDALAAAVTAKLRYGRLRTLPAEPERDAFGLPMEITFL